MRKEVGRGKYGLPGTPEKPPSKSPKAITPNSADFVRLNKIHYKSSTYQSEYKRPSLDV